ncbi:MAG: DNA gyrase inhibitor YacG [Pirellulales bacterium]
MCPICGSAFESNLSSAMPFCSERCRQVDLGRWFNEEYSMPHTSMDEGEELYREEAN